MIRRKYWTTANCLGLMILLGGDPLSAAGPVKKQPDDAKAKMEAKGWKQISEGVFERRLGPDKVEHLGFGREGLSWTIGEMNRKLELLREEQESYPSEELSTVIDDLTVRIDEAHSELRKLDQKEVDGISSMTQTLSGPNCSSMCYSATADAYPLTSSQGVGAVAEAKFNSTCGYSGDTYAFAYARATQGTTTTTITQEDPRTGTNVTSSASASVSGGLDCFSEAYASVSSSALGISYSTSDVNYSCPAELPKVTINGSSYEYFYTYGCRNVTWTSTVSGLNAPLSYQWKYDGTVVGSGSSYSRSVCPFDASFTLDLTVTGSNGSASDDHSVTVYTDISNCGGIYQPPCN